jgi:hypothetical protein
MIVKVFNNESAQDELCILEFQGEIIGDLNDTLSYIEIKSKTTAHMDLGQHTLDGDIIKLKNPFMILEKVKKASDDNTGESGSMSIQGIVKNKIIFKSRPQPKRLI